MFRLRDKLNEGPVRVNSGNLTQFISTSANGDIADIAGG